MLNSTGETKAMTIAATPVAVKCKSVSYTHLDVYKRQRLFIRFHYLSAYYCRLYFIVYTYAITGLKCKGDQILSTKV